MQKRKSFVYLTAKDKASEGILSLGRNNQDEEQEADEFARNILIPLREYEAFVNKKQFSALSIKEFSRRIDISEAIVLGRLQHDGHVDWNKHRSLAGAYEIVVAEGA